MTYDERQHSQLGPSDPSQWVLRRRSWAIYREWGGFWEGGVRTGYCNTWDTLKMAAHSQRLQLFVGHGNRPLSSPLRHELWTSPSAERVNVSSMSSTAAISPRGHFCVKHAAPLPSSRSHLQVEYRPLTCHREASLTKPATQGALFPSATTICSFLIHSRADNPNLATQWRAGMGSLGWAYFLRD